MRPFSGSFVDVFCLVQQSQHRCAIECQRGIQTKEKNNQPNVASNKERIYTHTHHGKNTTKPTNQYSQKTREIKENVNTKFSLHRNRGMQP